MLFEVTVNNEYGPAAEIVEPKSARVALKSQLSEWVVTLISSLGVIRLPDVYTLRHATTKSATLGVLFILLGAFVYFLFIHNSTWRV